MGTKHAKGISAAFLIGEAADPVQTDGRSSGLAHLRQVRLTIYTRKNERNNIAAIVHFWLNRGKIASFLELHFKLLTNIPYFFSLVKWDRWIEFCQGNGIFWLEYKEILPRQGVACILLHQLIHRDESGPLAPLTKGVKSAILVC